MRTSFCIGIASLLLTACHKQDDRFAGSGVFEAEEIVVSSLGTGQLLQFNINEGNTLDSGQVVGRIDCDDLTLQKSQVESSREALKLKQVEASPETAVIQKQIATQESEIAGLQTQYDVLNKEKERFAALVAKDAAPEKQLDDIQGQLDVLAQRMKSARAQLAVLNEQIQSAKRNAALRNRSIMSEDDPIQSQINRIEDQIANCTITNPVAGTILAKYVEPHEFVTTGKALYKIADLSRMRLRAYLTGDVLTAVELGQKVDVLVDDGKKGYRTYSGTISWISDKAEFTPKTIQTRDERANLVYAVKVDVENDGSLRIGMYGELEL